MPDAKTYRCEVCGADMVRDARPDEITIGGETETMMLPGWYCPTPGCVGESIHNGIDMRVTEAAVQRLLARARQGQEGQP